MTNEEVFELKELLSELSTKTRISDRTRERLSKANEFFDGVYESAKTNEFKKKYRGLRFSYKNYDPEAATSRMIEAVRNSTALFEEAQNDLVILDKETQDILHALEMCDLSSEQELSLMNDLRQIRINRRKCKNFIELVSPLVSFSRKHQPLLVEMKDVAKSIRQSVASIETRRYYPRVRTELDSSFEEAQNTYMSKEFV